MATLTTDLLTMAYDDTGPRDGQPVLLIHGWPDDATTWDDVLPGLHAAGLRTIVPTLRGFGATRLAAGAPRTGDSAVLAIDMIALADALGIARFMVAGHDWGANAAEALAVGWPDRVERMALLSSPPRLGGMPTPPFEQTQRQWYHWFMATQRGAEAIGADRRDFAHLHWTNWGPPGWFDEATFQRVARSWDNPDWLDVTLHSYRARWDEAEPDPRSRWLEEKVKATAALSLPTMYFQGALDGVNPPSASKDVPTKCTGPFAFVTLAGVGHFAPRENPRAVARHLVRLFMGDPARLADTTDRSLLARKAAPIAAGVAALGIGAAALALARGRGGAAVHGSAPDLLRPGWRESIRSVNGLNLHVVEAGEAGRPLLVLLHGFPEFWWAWRHQITPLADAGYHVVVPDMRGYNRSDAPPEVAAYALDTLAADVAALADTFAAERFHLVGHDWGAVIGWWVAARYPQRLNRVVLMDGPHPDIWGRQALKHPTQALRSTYVAFFQLPWVPEATLGGFDFAGLKAMMQGSAKPDTFEPGALDLYAEAWAHPGSLTAMLNYYRALRERPRAEEPARLAPPTLILWAEDDRFLERHVAEAGLALCDDGRLEMIEGASHWLHIEQPERITARIVEFLAAPA